MTTVIYPGSFDPFTNGHLNLVDQASTLFNTVIVVVASNATKTEFICPQTRAQGIREDVKHLKNVKVEILDKGTLLTDFMMRQKIFSVVRGIRNGTEFDSETAYIENLDALLDFDEEPIYPVFLKSQTEFSRISSSAFKSIFACSGWVQHLAKYLPDCTANLVISENKQKFREDLWFSACKYLAQNYNESVHTCNLGFIKLSQGYSRKGYHTINHIDDCLLKYYNIGLEKTFHSFDYHNIMALFWHDFVYVPGAIDNEDKSAEACRQFLQSIGASSENIDDTCNEILTTKSETVIEGSYVRDVDLSILAADPADYNKYKELIEVEFEDFDKTQFNSARIKWLQKMLTTKEIFSTYYFKSRYEHQARINLENELKERTAK